MTSAVSVRASRSFPPGTPRVFMSSSRRVRAWPGTGFPPVPFSPVTSPTPETTTAFRPVTLVYWPT